MEKISLTSIQELLYIDNSQPAVTIYCPMHKSASPPHMTAEQIRFKNMIHKASAMLRARGGAEDLEKALIKKLDELMSDQNFWEERALSLLLCARPGSIRMFDLPADTEEYAAVDDSFHLAPVLSILQEEVSFYLLTVAQHDPKLFKGDLYGLYETEVKLPATIEQGLNLDEVNQKSEHARSAAGSSLGTTGFQGRGGARNFGEEDRARFFRMLDHIVYTNTDRSFPIILAGIDAETAEFRTLSKYPKILNKTIRGSFGNAKPQQLSELARNVIHEEVILSGHQSVVNEYETVRGTNPERVATSKEAIATAAEQGRIDKLLVRVLRTTTDTVRETKKAVGRITFPEIDVSSHVNHMASKVWQTSGKIIGLSASEMPDGALMVARLRY